MADISRGNHSTVCGLHEALSGQGSVVPKVLTPDKALLPAPPE